MSDNNKFECNFTLGNYGDDTSKELISFIFQSIKKKTKNNHLDIIILNGDFIGHDIDAEEGTSEF